MLLINARAGRSTLHGYGLIALEFVPCGTVVWRFQPGFDVSIPEAGLERLSPAAREQVRYYAYFHRETGSFVLSSDDDRFANHTDDPNTRSQDNVTVAVRDIHPGEEITNDYTELVMLNYPSGDRP